MDALFSCLFLCVNLRGTDGQAADALCWSLHCAFGESGPRRDLEIEIQRGRRKRRRKGKGSKRRGVLKERSGVCPPQYQAWLCRRVSSLRREDRSQRTPSITRGEAKDMTDSEVSGFHLNFDLFKYWIPLMLAIRQRHGSARTKHSIRLTVVMTH